jgi:Tol biopolymer transport system component
VAALASPGIAHADTATTNLITVAADGVTPSGGSDQPSISADGRYVAFISSARDLVPGDTNGATDVFVRDRQTGVTTRASVDSAGTQADNVSENPSISGDGRYVVFSSYASNLVSGDTNRRSDIFLHDMRTGATSRLSTGSVGDQANSDSYSPVISADGQFVAFDSYASNLIADDTNGTHDIFEYSRQWNTTTRVSVDSVGLQSNGLSWQPAISADGRYVEFASDASNLVAGDTNHTGDVFVHDRLTVTTDLVSVNNNGQPGDSVSRFAAISGDGRYVVFNSYASNLAPGDTNDESDIFVRDREAGTTTRIDLDVDGRQLPRGTSANVYPSISADGRLIAYESGVDSLVAGDVNHEWDVFLWNRDTATTALGSVATDGTPGDSASGEPSISADGRHLAFESVAKNFAPGMPEFGYSANIYARDLVST